MKQLTVKDLYNLCKAEMENGNAERLIVMNGNSEKMQGLFWGFIEITEKDKYYHPMFPMYDSLATNIDKIIVLG